MTKNLYESNIRKLIKTIDTCFKDKEIISGLILFYSIIDIMAWLSRDPHDADSTKSDFIRWVEEFLLPGSALKCTADELFSARCSVIHTYAPEWGSGLSHKVEAVKFSYFWGKETSGENKNDSSQKSETVALYIDDLVYSLKVAIQRFEDSLSYNRSLSELTAERSQKYFIEIARG